MLDFTNCLPEELHQHLGARPTAADATEFSLWAPAAQRVVVDVLGGPQSVPLRRSGSGLHRGIIEGVTPGDRYFYRLDGGPRRPDPASRFQPDGVHGPSEVIRTEFDWSQTDWLGIDRDALIIYEMHVGALTESGTYQAAGDRLPELVDLGVTAVELMPLAASAGRWNWGYDGVALFAPFAAYGTPDDLRRFVDRAHGLGLAVLLDVVYNHLGPEGNYLSEFGPYLSPRHGTVWGDAPNFDGADHGSLVRRFFCGNAIYWLDEFRFDGLRVDAIHCMADTSDPHIAAEIQDGVRRWSDAADRPALLIAESNVYDPEMTHDRDAGGIGFDAMWCDDFLHSTFAALRPGEQLSNRHYEPHTDLARVLESGYVYEGTLRRDRERTTPPKRVASDRLVYSIQNHDFIGNHPLGMRLHQVASAEAQRAAAALMLLHPAIPMLFMGEEFACQRPFRFFVDFGDEDLQSAVVAGRRREYPQHDWDAGILPTDPDAFLSAKIGDADQGDPVTRRWYRDLIALRKQLRGFGLLHDDHLSVQSDPNRNLYVMRYRHDDLALVVAVRLSPHKERDEASIQQTVEVAGEAAPLLDSLGNGSGGGGAGLGRLFPNHAVVSASIDLTRKLETA